MNAGRLAASAIAVVSVPSPVLIGREQEMAALLDAVTHPPALTVVQGEAGVGKSRLVGELLRHPALKDRQRLVGRCRPLSEPFVLEPVIDALRGLRRLTLTSRPTPVTGVLRPLLPELGTLLPPSIADVDDLLLQRHLLFRAALDLLRSVGPAICVLEDLHWADEYTAEFLRFAESHLPSGLSLVATFRREDVPDTSPLVTLGARREPDTQVVRLSLSPLSPEQVRAMMLTILRTKEISDEFARFVHGRTEGVPFAVEEVLRLVVDRRELVLHRGRWIRRTIDNLVVPASISDSVSERVARLGPEARRLVEAEAVLAAPAGVPLLAAVAGLSLEEAISALREALGSALLTEDGETGECSFRHSLGTQAVYERMPLALRRTLHERAAIALELVEPRPLPVLAYHYRAAGRRDEWIACAEAAADVAVSVHDDAAAVHLLQAVVADGSLAPSDLSRLAVKLGHATVRGLTARPEVVRVLSAVVDGSELAADVRGELRYLLGVMLVTAGDGAAAQREWERAVPELAERPALAIKVMTHLAYPWVPLGTAEDHLRWLARAVEAAEGYGDDDVRMSVTTSRMQTLLGLGEPGAWDALEELPRAATSPETQRMLVWTWFETAMAAIQLGHIRRARELLDTGVRTAEAFEYRAALGAADATRLSLRWAMGDWDGLEAEADRLADVHADSPLWSITAQAVSAFVAHARGDLDKAQRLFRHCMEESHASPAMYALAGAQLARVRLARGQPEAAWAVVSPGLEAMEAKQIWAWSHWVVPAAIETLIALQRIDDAAALVQRAARGLRGRDAPWSEAALSYCRGLVAEARGQPRDAVKWFADAEQRFLAMPLPYEAARAQERKALGQLDSGDPMSEKGLRDAVDGFVALGATADERRVRRALRLHDIAQPSPWRRGRIGYGDKLSPREAAVARLAARGRTNSEIATELFLSPKTVEHHVGACMRKLKVRSRVELANRLSERED